MINVKGFTNGRNDNRTYALPTTVYTMNEKRKKRQQANLETTKAREVIGHSKSISWKQQHTYMYMQKKEEKHI
jgi:hypothetical protein